MAHYANCILNPYLSHTTSPMHFFVDPDIAKARTLHSDFYTEARWFEESKEKIFAASWQPVGHRQELEAAGSCQPVRLMENFLDEPLLLTNDNGTIHCLSNVCTHRGNILCEDSQQSRHIRCKYHGRLFGLDGAFRSMPEFEGVCDFPSPADDLTRVPLHQWGPFLFASLQPITGAPAFLQEMQAVSRAYGNSPELPFNDFDYRPELSKEYVVNAHWALYCENYLEGFHIPFVHADLNTVIDYGSYSTELFRYSNRQIAYAKNDEACFENTPGGKKIAAFYYFVFPNLMFNFYPWGLSVNIVLPQGPELTRVQFLTYMWDESKYSRGAGGDLDKVEKEDEAIVENVQKGIRSRYYAQGRYSVTRETGTHHFHRLVAEFLNR